MNTKYVIALRFNSDTEVAGRCKVDNLSKEWISERIAIFNRYTRQCLEKQSNQDFIAVLSCQEQSMEYIKEELKKYKPLNANIIFTSKKQEVIENYIKDADKVYIAALDSDDVYKTGVVQYLHDYKEKPNEHLIIFNRGYIYNGINSVIDDYECVSPPYYVQIFNVKDYLTTYRYYKMMRHFYMQRLEHTCIDVPMFILILHNSNSFQYYKQEHPKLFGTEQILDNWKEILSSFGLN